MTYKECRLDGCYNVPEGRKWYCEEHRHKPCDVEGCDRDASSPQARYCDAHRARLQQYGDMQADVPIRDGAGRPSQLGICQEEVCDRPVQARGMCRKHYHQWWVSKRKAQRE